MTSCQAIRQGDEMHCPRCRIRWDIAESSPCPRQVTVATRAHDEDLERSNRFVSGLPDPFI